MNAMVSTEDGSSSSRRPAPGLRWFDPVHSVDVADKNVAHESDGPCTRTHVGLLNDVDVAVR